MSKMDDLRAMREARYAKNTADPAATRKAAPKVAPGPTEAAAPAAPEAGARCGHSSINGRTCTREVGHAAKSHRYS